MVQSGLEILLPLSSPMFTKIYMSLHLSLYIHIPIALASFMKCQLSLCFTCMMYILENLFVTPNIGYIKEIYPYLKTVEESQKDG